MKDTYTKAPTHVVEWICIADSTATKTTANNGLPNTAPPTVGPTSTPIVVKQARRDPSLYVFMTIVLLFFVFSNRNITLNSRNKEQVVKASFVDMPDQMEVIQGMLTIDDKNPHAPVSHGKLGKREMKGFVQRFAPVAIAEMHKYDIPASIKMAQGIIEARAGTSKLARENNNFFGMKCFSRRCKKEHCTNATDDHHKDFFRKYTTAWESWRDHSKLLQGDRYKHLKKFKRDYKKWAKGLKKAGYATDKNYDKKLIDVIEHYQLHKLDAL